MITQREIEEYAQAVAQKFHPLKIVLFGSYAHGVPTTDSDVDLMVVLPEGALGKRNRDRAIAIDAAVPAGFPLDLLVRTPADLEWRLAEGDCFLRDVFAKGRVLYEAAL